MPQDSKHFEYEDRAPQWKRCRDIYNGSDAVKDAGEDYLPRPSAQSSKDYKNYKMRALFYDAFSRTIEGFVGAISRKEANVKCPESFEAIVKNTDLCGLSIDELNKAIVRELLITDRCSLLVDFDQVEKRAYVKIYKAEQVINWWPDGSVMIEECVSEADPKDKYLNHNVKQWRHLHYDEKGFYAVTIWRKNEAGSAKLGNEFYVYKNLEPSNRNQRLKKIPFFTVTTSGSLCLEKPPLLGLADIVISHYQTSADLEHGRHFTALPTLYVVGADSGTAIQIGGNSAIILPEGGSCGYAEFSGQGLASLEKGLERKENQMATLGAGLAANNKNGIEAAETAKIRVSGEMSILNSIVASTEEVLEQVLKSMADWMRISGEVEVELNRDFIGEKINAEDIKALLLSLSSGAISLEVFLHNLYEGEMLPPNTTVDEIASKVRSENEKNKEDFSSDNSKNNQNSIAE